jgi:micrococcal nuclease
MKGQVLKDSYIRAVGLLTGLAAITLVIYRVFFWSGTPLQSNYPQVRQNHFEECFHHSGTDRQYYTVKQVLDGDTMLLENGVTVRLIGVNTPETNHPEVPVQRFGKEATEFTRRMAEGMKVTMEFVERKKDIYDRTLAYIFIDGELLNKKIIECGYGYANRRFAHPRMDEFITAEKQARARQYGLWNYCLSDGRITNLVNRYEHLSSEGKRKLDQIWDRLLQEYPDAGKIEPVKNNETGKD